MERFLFSLLGVLFTASIAAFFLFVPMWPVFAVTLVLIGLVVMFMLGLHIGRQSLSAPRMTDAGEPRGDTSTVENPTAVDPIHSTAG